MKTTSILAVLALCATAAFGQTTNGKTYINPNVSTYSGNPNCTGTNYVINETTMQSVFVTGTYGAVPAAYAVAVPNGVGGALGDIVVDTQNNILWQKTAPGVNVGWTPLVAGVPSAALTSSTYNGIAATSPALGNLIATSSTTAKLYLTGSTGIIVTRTSGSAATISGF